MQISSGPGHMTNMAAMPIYGKDILKHLPQNQTYNVLGL